MFLLNMLGWRWWFSSDSPRGWQYYAITTMRLSHRAEHRERAGRNPTATGADLVAPYRRKVKPPVRPRRLMESGHLREREAPRGSHVIIEPTPTTYKDGLPGYSGAADSWRRTRTFSLSWLRGCVIMGFRMCRGARTWLFLSVPFFFFFLLNRGGWGLGWISGASIRMYSCSL